MNEIINVNCPSCGTQLRSQSKYDGHRVACPNCNHRFRQTSPDEAVTNIAVSDSDKSGVAVEPQQGILLVEKVEFKPQARQGIGSSDIQFYKCGIGSEYVYCYTYPHYQEMATLKGETDFRIKVGSAIGDPLERIYQQFAASKTAIPEQPNILLLFQTLSARHLERWLHQQLNRANDATGSEWFKTNTARLIELYRQYVATAAASPVVSVECDSTGEPAPDRLRQIKMSAGSNLGQVSKPEEVVIFVRQLPTRKRQEEITSRSKMEARQIHDVLERHSPVSVKSICENTGLSLRRVLSHVNWAIGRGLARLQNKTRQ